RQWRWRQPLSARPSVRATGSACTVAFMPSMQSLAHRFPPHVSQKKQPKVAAAPRRAEVARAGILGYCAYKQLNAVEQFLCLLSQSLYQLRQLGGPKQLAPAPTTTQRSVRLARI